MNRFDQEIVERSHDCCHIKVDTKSQWNKLAGSRNVIETDISFRNGHQINVIFEAEQFVMIAL